jgi:two-component system osmolarity sensor histidine kinase EnvZ
VLTLVYALHEVVVVSGVGVAIGRDIARSHGGDISLGESPLGGLRATVRVPV